MHLLGDRQDQRHKAGCDTISCEHCQGVLYRLLSVESYFDAIDTYTFECRACESHVQINLPGEIISFH